LVLGPTPGRLEAEFRRLDTGGVRARLMVMLMTLRPRRVAWPARRRRFPEPPVKPASGLTPAIGCGT